MKKCVTVMRLQQSAPGKASAHVPAAACNGEGEAEHMCTELAEILQALSGMEHKAQSITKRMAVRATACRP
jgi:hypothetical protein